MRPHLLLFFSLIIFSSISYGQKTVYFDDNWLSIEKAEAKYYSVIYPISGGKYQVKDYTISGTLLSETDYLPKADFIEWERLYEEGFQDSAIEDGKCIEYFPNGNKKKQFSYTKGVQEGNIRLWTQDGKLLRDFIAQNKLANGLYLEYYPNGKASLSVNFKNDTLNGPAAYYIQMAHYHKKVVLKMVKNLGSGLTGQRMEM